MPSYLALLGVLSTLSFSLRNSVGVYSFSQVCVIG